MGGETTIEGKGFQTTHWTVVLEARDGHGGLAQQALERLCASYWYPLYGHIRRRGVPPQDAEDLTQEFLLRFVRKDSLANVSPRAGRFRSFLLTCLKNFLVNQHERSHAQRRGGGCSFVSIDLPEAETRYARESEEGRTDEVMFDRRWATALLDQTMEALRQEYVRSGQAGAFAELQAFLPGGQNGASRAELAARRGVSPGAIDVAIHRVRQRFGTLLRERVAQTVGSPTDVEEELRYLIDVLAA